LCGLEIPTKKAIFGPQGCGALRDKKFIKKEFFFFLEYL